MRKPRPSEPPRALVPPWRNQTPGVSAWLRAQPPQGQARPPQSHSLGSLHPPDVWGLEMQGPPVSRAQSVSRRPAREPQPAGRPTQTARRPRDLRVCGAAVVLGALEGQAAEPPLDVEAGLVDGAVVDAGHTLIDVCERARGSPVKVEAARALATPDGEPGPPPAQLLSLQETSIYSSYSSFTVPGTRLTTALEELWGVLSILLTVPWAIPLLSSFRGGAHRGSVTSLRSHML